METPKEEVKEKPTEGDVDDKGVSFQNRVKEAARKETERYERDLAQARREIEELRGSKPAETKEDPEAARMAKLRNFTEDPDAYIEGHLARRSFQAEVPEAEQWLKSRPGYSAEDEAKILQIITERRLNTPYHTPMQRAKTAWDILEAEKLRKEFNDKTDETKREANVSTASTEGTGRAVPKKNTLSRAEIIRKLGEASAKGDFQAEIYYTNMLEDVRE